MKKLLYTLIAAVLFFSSAAQAEGKRDVPEKGVIKMIKDCYIAYNATWATTSGTILRKKLDSLQKKYCTDKLINKLKTMPDFDLLGFNQYTDLKHLNTLTVTRDAADGNLYLVSYIVHSTKDDKPVDEKVTIQVSVVKEDDGFKIDYVQ